MDQSKLSPKPIVFSVDAGMYDCSSCSPQIKIKADGEDQSVTGQAFDTESVKAIDPHSVQLVTKKNGKIIGETTRAVSDDGKTLTIKNTSHPENSDQTVNSEVTLTRVARAC
jgi:exopolysaccharide biosynthesis protein